MAPWLAVPFGGALKCTRTLKTYQWTFRFQKYRLPKCTHYPPTHFFHPYTFGIFWETKFQFDTYVSDGWLNHHATTTTTIRQHGVSDGCPPSPLKIPTVSASPRSFHIEPYGNRSAKTWGVQRGISSSSPEYPACILQLACKICSERSPMLYNITCIHKRIWYDMICVVTLCFKNPSHILFEGSSLTKKNIEKYMIIA